MKSLLDPRLFWCLGTAALFWLATSSGHLFSQSSSSPAVPQPSSMQVVSSTNINGIQQLVVLDQSVRSLAVYHVDATGNVQLRSVRTLVWDLRMEEFNGVAPTPSELRKVQP